jgi:23S rRNA-/tRNA-specific pseudouridylate synthase
LQITVDGEVATDPDMILREGSKLVYHRLPWQEPFAPHLLDVLYEDDDMVCKMKIISLLSMCGKLLGHFFPSFGVLTILADSQV